MGSEMCIRDSNNTLIVLACVLIVGIFICIFDAVGGVVVNGIISLVKG